MTALARLAEARSVLRDAWLEAGGCERCGGTGVTVEEEPWPGEEALKPQGRFDPRALFSPPTGRVHLPTHPMLRRYPCDGEHSAGIDPAMGYDDIAKRLRPSSVGQRTPETSEDVGRRRIAMLPMGLPSIEGTAGQTLATTVQSQVHFRGVKLVAIESDVGRTSIAGWFVGAMNQMPMSGYGNGIPSRCFAPDVRDNEIDIDVLQPAMMMTINIHFRQSCRWEGTLFGETIL